MNKDIYAIMSKAGEETYSNHDLIEAINSGSNSNVHDILNSAVINARITKLERPVLMHAVDEGNVDKLLALLHLGGHLELTYVGPPDIIQITHLSDLNALLMAAISNKETPVDPNLVQTEQEKNANNAYIAECISSTWNMSRTLIQQNHLGKQVNTRIVGNIVVPIFEGLEKGIVDLSLFMKTEARALIEQFLLNKAADLSLLRNPDDTNASVKRSRI